MIACLLFVVLEILRFTPHSNAADPLCELPLFEVFDSPLCSARSGKPKHPREGLSSYETERDTFSIPPPSPQPFKPGPRHTDAKTSEKLKQ